MTSVQTMIDPATLYVGKSFLYLVPYDAPKSAGVREIHISRRKGEPDRVTGINVLGSDFDLDGRCRVAPWVRIVAGVGT